MNNAIFRILRYSGLPFLFRELIQRRMVTIVMMHDMSVRAAEQAFRYWKKHYNIISFNDYLKARQGKAKLPPKSLILTFDDGHKGNFLLMPVIEKMQIPVTIFLCSSITGTNRHFWFLQKNIAPDKLKKLPDAERINKLRNAGFEEEKEYPGRQALSREEIDEMKRSPFFDFQSHTRTHPILPQCVSSKASEEISGSKTELEEKYGLKIRGFAYPNGDYSEREIEMVEQAGYDYALTTDAGYNSINTNPFKLKRFSVNDSESIDEIIVKTSGIWGLLKKLQCRIYL
ncbi:MAG: polysaccharide deacetylase family protein [Chlorobi bacterium]|nr:polysaccharide deacetylase family protein [Chlorobiota bacterium]